MVCELEDSRICYLLSLLRIHSPDCEHCNARETRGDEMRKRLEELSWRTQPRSRSLKKGDHGEAVEDSDSKLPKLWQVRRGTLTERASSFWGN